MPTINILHKRDLKHSFRKIEIFLNGKNIGNLSKCIETGIEIPAGKHKIAANMKNFRSRDYYFTIFNKENKSIFITTNKGSITPFIIYTLVEIFLVGFAGRLNLDHRLTRMIPLIGAFLWVFFIVIGRKSFLKIEEERLK